MMSLDFEELLTLNGNENHFIFVDACYNCFILHLIYEKKIKKSYINVLWKSVQSKIFEEQRQKINEKNPKVLFILNK